MKRSGVSVEAQQKSSWLAKLVGEAQRRTNSKLAFSFQSFTEFAHQPPLSVFIRPDREPSGIQELWAPGAEEGVKRVCRSAGESDGVEKKKRKPTSRGIKCHAPTIRAEKHEAQRQTPACAALAEREGKSTRKGARRGVGRRERIKRESGIKDREVRSRGIETLMAEAVARFKPTEPLRLARQAVPSDPIPPVVH